MQYTLLLTGDIRKYEISMFLYSLFLIVERFLIFYLCFMYININLVVRSGKIWTVHCSLDGEKMGRERDMLEGQASRRR